MEVKVLKCYKEILIDNVIVYLKYYKHKIKILANSFPYIIVYTWVHTLFPKTSQITWFV